MVDGHQWRRGTIIASTRWSLQSTRWTLPGTLFQSEHENARVMSDAHCVISANKDARAMSDTRDTMLAHETMSTYARVKRHKLPQMGHPQTGFMSNDDSKHESPRELPYGYIRDLQYEYSRDLPYGSPRDLQHECQRDPQHESPRMSVLVLTRPPVRVQTRPPVRVPTGCAGRDPNETRGCVQREPESKYDNITGISLKATGLKSQE